MEIYKYIKYIDFVKSENLYLPRYWVGISPCSHTLSKFQNFKISRTRVHTCTGTAVPVSRRVKCYSNTCGPRVYENRIFIHPCVYSVLESLELYTCTGIQYLVPGIEYRVYLLEQVWCPWSMLPMASCMHACMGGYTCTRPDVQDV